jgi:transglutaminase-like putative cysteine protease
MPVASFDTIPSGFRGTEATINRMLDLIAKGKVDLGVQRVADLIIQKSACAPREYLCKAQALYNFLKSYIRFERDPFGVEMLQEPIVTLNRKAGDCDDHTILACAIFGAVGFPYAIKTIKADSRRPDEFSHVYAVVNIPGKGWLGADTSVDPAYLGWEPPGKFPSKLWMPKAD